MGLWSFLRCGAWRRDAAAASAAGRWDALRPDGAVGFGVPVFIDNFHLHLTNAFVYGDGVVDAWGGLDLDLFRKKVGEGWVVLAPKAGATLSIFDLGHCRISAPHARSRDEKAGAIMEALTRRLNPAMTGLVDLEGEDSAPIPGAVEGARRSKLGWCEGKPFRVGADGARVEGRQAPIFLRGATGWRLTRWFVFADGSSRFGATGAFQPLDEAAACFSGARPMAATQVPDGTRVSVDGLCDFTVAEGYWFVSAQDRVAQAYDDLVTLRGERGSIQTCREAMKAHETAPTPQTLATLRAAYEAVPTHHRIYCGDMDTKDFAIRRALGLTAND